MSAKKVDIEYNLKNQKDFIMKFNDAPFGENNILNPGWAEPTYDDFFVRMTAEPVFLNQSTVIPMKAEQHDLDMLEQEFDFDSQRDNRGVSTGLGTDYLEPGMGRKQLVAQPLKIATVITDNFIEENIEGEDFMTTYVNLIADEAGPAFERFGIFAETGGTSIPGERSGFKTTNGVLAQCKQISSDTNKDEYGFSKLVYQDNVGIGIMEAIERYIQQDGDISNATCVLPPEIYARLMIEIAQDKETDLGDAVYQEANLTSILGIEIVNDKVLRATRNGFDKMRFNAEGEFKGNGSVVDRMKYGFIGQPTNIVFGMMREFDIKNQWDIDVLGFKVACLCKGDVSILHDQDTLAIPFTMNKSE